MRFLTADQMRDWDRCAIAERGIPGLSLMSRAGAAVARVAADLAACRGCARMVAVAGRGNNGGDACVAARLLHAAGLPVEMLATAPADLLRGDARTAWDQMVATGVPVRVLPDDAAWQAWSDEAAFPRGVVVIDGLLGTGSTGAPRGVVAAAIRWINAVRRQGGVVAVDLPSGLDADSGAPSDPVVLADITVSFGAPKCGFANPRAWQALGRVEIAEIGLPADGMPVSGDRTLAFIAAPDLSRVLPERARDGHKGCFGHVLVIGGSRGLTGAPALAALGALHGGAGLVSAAAPAASVAVLAAQAPAVMAYTVETAADGGMTPATLAAGLTRRLDSLDVIAAGPGLSAGVGTAALVAALLSESCRRLVLDADALNVLARQPEVLRRVVATVDGDASVIITPHPGEAARLLGLSTAAVQADRLAAVRALAARTGAVAVLKGAGTLVGSPDGRVALNLTGNPAMASGGSGDVLTGLIAALWAQGLSAVDAARLGVWLHGTAGDRAAWQSGARALPAEVLARGLDGAWRWLAREG